MVSKLSQSLDKPGQAQVSAVKRLLKYTQGTKSYSLIFEPTNGLLTGHVDADWVSDTADRRSTAGYTVICSCTGSTDATDANAYCLMSLMLNTVEKVMVQNFFKNRIKFDSNKIFFI